jgi:CRISPR-associated protein (TIGR03985 family)
MFDCPPSVEFLTTLARGSLRQDLPRAVRLWVILHSIYGEEIGLNLAQQFTYNEWRDRFFTQTQTYHQRDRVPTLHDATCNCAKTLKSWLFESDIGTNETSWRISFLQLYQLSEAELDKLIETGFSGRSERQANLEQPAKQPGRKPLPDGRLFAVTGKQLQIDFADLVQLGWLKKTESVFQHVDRLPNVSQAREASVTVNFSEVLSNVIETDAVDLFEHLGQPICGIQRLFLDIEYIVPNRLSEKVRDLQQQLKQLWEDDPVAPICLTYRSARLYGEVDRYVVYPVCVCYFQRAPYLFAYGLNPQSPKQDSWYDFRLDRIEELAILEWSTVHESLRNRCFYQTPPCPNAVRQSLSEVWGFDIYSPSETLLIRFNQYFHSHYVRNTERETLLSAVNTTVASRLIRCATLEPSQQDSLLSIVEKKPKDIYCRVSYRLNDRNVLMRLRAWGANVEVLLPWSLRVQMAKEMHETWKLYQSALE